MSLTNDREWSTTQYTTVEDVKRDPNMNTLLNITKIEDGDILERIKDASDRMEMELGPLDTSRTVATLCRKMVILDIAEGKAIAEQTGAQERVSRMGLIPRLERDIRELKYILRKTPKLMWL